MWYMIFFKFLFSFIVQSYVYEVEKISKWYNTVWINYDTKLSEGNLHASTLGVTKWNVK